MAKVLVLYYSSFGHIETMADAIAEGARAAAKGEHRAHSVAVPFDLPDVVIESRLEESTQDLVHHLYGVVVGRGARWARQPDRKRALRRPGFVHQVDGGGLEWRRGRILERGLAAAGSPAGNYALDTQLCNHERSDL